MFDILINEILSTPAILIGLFVLFGNLLLKKSTTDVISSTFKTIIGFTMLNLGAGIVGEALESFGVMFTEAFDLQAAIMDTGVYGALLTETYYLTPIIFIFGLILNLIIAKYTRFKYIYLTGHVALYMSGMLAMILDGFNPMVTIIVGAIILGVYMAISPAILQKYTADITGTDEFSVANTGSLSFFLAAKVGEWFGNKENTTENIKVPHHLGFLQDSTVSMSLTMSLLFIFVSFFTGADFIEANLSNGQNFIFFSFMQGIIFAAGVQVLLFGINMAIDELIPAFQGIADRIIDGAVPGVDAPLMAKYSPNAMILGFITSLIASILGMFVLTLLDLPLIIPGMVQHFFLGGVAATYGNNTGGRQGAFIGSFLNGLIMSIFPSLFLAFVDAGVSDVVILGDSDYTFIGLLLKLISQLFT